MLKAVPNPSTDERAFLEAMINADSVADRIAAYGRIVSDTGKLRERIVSTNKKLNALDISLEELKGDPKYAEIYEVQTAIRSSRQEGVSKLSRYADGILPELKTIKEGLELIRALDKCTPFLTEAHSENLKSVERILALIEERQIFVKHGLTAWPREFSDARIRPALRNYSAVVNLAYKVLKSPPRAVIEISEPRVPELSNTVSEDRGLRKQALIDANLPESIRDDERLKQISAKMLQQRIKKILKLTDNDPIEMSQICERHPDVLFDQSRFSNFVRRILLLNQLALVDPKNKRSTYDPILASDLRTHFLDAFLQGSDQKFFDLYRRVRESVQTDRANPLKQYPSIDAAFVERVSPKASHPLASEELTSANVIKFLKSAEFYAWKNDARTDLALQSLILNKLSAHHVGAPREDWIKANFEGKGFSSLANEMLRNTLDQLISDGKVLLSNPARTSKSGLRLAR